MGTCPPRFPQSSSKNICRRFFSAFIRWFSGTWENGRGFLPKPKGKTKRGWSQHGKKGVQDNLPVFTWCLFSYLIKYFSQVHLSTHPKKTSWGIVFFCELFGYKYRTSGGVWMSRSQNKSAQKDLEDFSWALWYWTPCPQSFGGAICLMGILTHQMNTKTNKRTKQKWWVLTLELTVFGVVSPFNPSPKHKLKWYINDETPLKFRDPQQ